MLVSIIFYSWSSPIEHTLVLLGSVIFNYCIGRKITQLYETSQGQLCRWILATGVTLNICGLGYFKYSGFIAANLGAYTFFSHVVLPLGISFFTFTQIAYLVDASRGLAKEYNLVHYFLFVTYFPHLIAGPILHHKEMMPQFNRSHIFNFRLDNFSIGFSIFVIGLAKKLLLADQVAPIADATFNSAGSGLTLTITEAWLGSLAYTIQIYFDFSAYSDMAIGISRILGIRLPINFASPYKAVSIIDFWHRWHMTLSRFLRDYLYIPLGGNRNGSARRFINLIITMILGGLWHGAGWTFIVWGGLHGVYLCINHLWRNFFPSPPRVIALSITFISVVTAWVFFRAETIDQGFIVLQSMFGFKGLSLPKIGGQIFGLLETNQTYIRFDGMFNNGVFDDPIKTIYTIFTMLFIIWGFPNTQQLFERYRPALIHLRDSNPIFRWQPKLIWCAYLSVIFVVSVFAISEDSPFLYFRF